MQRFAYLLCGPSLAGKSTAALALSKALCASIICSDDINAGRGLPFGAEGLPESAWAETLRLQLLRMAELAAVGRNVIADDTLCYRWLRDRHREAARACGLEPVLLVLAPSKDDLLERHSRAAGARPVLGLERLKEHLARFEWPGRDENSVDITSPDQLAAFIASRAQATIPLIRKFISS